ncbi:hypothetical protein GW915_09545 [bacterium]|nr:hypothetical protein [bacterium]
MKINKRTLTSGFSIMSTMVGLGIAGMGLMLSGVLVKKLFGEQKNAEMIAQMEQLHMAAQTEITQMDLVREFDDFITDGTLGLTPAQASELKACFTNAGTSCTQFQSADPLPNPGINSKLGATLPFDTIAGMAQANCAAVSASCPIQRSLTYQIICPSSGSCTEIKIFLNTNFVDPSNGRSISSRSSQIVVAGSAYRDVSRLTFKNPTRVPTGVNANLGQAVYPDPSLNLATTNISPLVSLSVPSSSCGSASTPQGVGSTNPQAAECSPAASPVAPPSPQNCNISPAPGPTYGGCSKSCGSGLQSVTNYLTYIASANSLAAHGGTCPIPNAVGRRVASVGQRACNTQPCCSTGRAPGPCCAGFVRHSCSRLGCVRPNRERDNGGSIRVSGNSTVTRDFVMGSWDDLRFCGSSGSCSARKTGGGGCTSDRVRVTCRNTSRNTRTMSYQLYRCRT